KVIRLALRIGLPAVVFFVTTLTNAPANAQKLPGGFVWSKAAPFPEKMEELYGLEMNGQEWILGGLTVNRVPMGLVYMYDPATDKWTKKGTFPKRVHHQGEAIYNGKIYIFGGCTQMLSAEASVANAWVYDPAIDSWKAIKSMPERRCSPRAQQVGGKIYVIG